MPLVRSLHFGPIKLTLQKSQLIISLVIALVLVLVNCFDYGQRNLLNLNMPDVRPAHDESYLCVAKRLDPMKSQYIVGFQPNASASKVHHILIYGCARPGMYLRDTPDYVWECGEMNNALASLGSDEQPYERGPICGSGSLTILFGWALDAPAVELPSGVGFKIGGGESPSGIDYLVLQVHYGHTGVFQRDPSLTDNSGIILETVTSGINKLAGIYLFYSYGYVEQGLSRHTMKCRFDENTVIHPFRFRTHTHKLGVKVAGYVRPQATNGEPQSSALLIGEHDPQQPQMFYPVENKSLTIKQGDFLHAYCDYDNTRERVVYIGATANDEMCNFYMMYWTEAHELLRKSDCPGYNPRL